MMETDAILIRRSLDEPEAFSVVYSRHREAIYRYVARRLGNDGAGQVASEVFLQAFATRAAYVPTYGSALPWLLGIANRLVANERRREVRHLERESVARSHADAMPVIDFQHDVIADVDFQATWPRLAGALARLPEEQRDAFLLFAWGELTYPQIAVALGVPVGTVRSRISRAREQLRAQLEDHKEEL